ncbi:EF-hand domain-containing protein 1-like isoform X2 [Biomphalaria pfeifferi]|uniref:EF-hand domain-containing protein 1-like isoform X2 n=1 Tax=Biomphalaria pfeifferi TaxID=112525 RepID=A0AAD8AV05_BIOPF|nr:EF-hand domain-containing protein 1-like isoform X2 [Biomphalaria pfeifferi]
MEGLPFLPGNTFRDPTQMKYHVSQTLGYKNGYAIPKRPEVGVGGTQLFYNNLSESELDELANFNPTLTYGQAKQAAPAAFIPAHVAWDKKVLKFNGYFKQTVHESPDEYYRVRPVDIYYYLEDDSIAVIEPHVENSGMPQGKLIKRQRLPKNDQGDTWHWKDLNLGMNIVFYGKSFHITNCDKFTKDFLESEGIEVNEAEFIPTDTYIQKRADAVALRTYTTQSAFDKLKQFKELDRKVLRFYCVWDDRDSMFGEMRPFLLHYYLVDDTLEIREVHTPNDGRDPFPVLIGRHKIPKDRFNVPASFPGAVLELTDQEIKNYFTPKDFQIGKTLQIYGRRFLIYDCDNFTKGFYYNHFGITNFDPVEVKGVAKTLPKMEIAEYNNFGSLEDSLQSCNSLVPQPAKKDFIKMLENDHKELRFEAIMDTMRAEDRGRRFIISYRLADDMITIFEPPVKNSGIIGGKFLERTRVAKPGSTLEKPQYYGPQDFYIGAVIEIFRHRFIITNADAYVLKYIEDHKNQFPDQMYMSIKEKVGEYPGPKESVKGGPMKVQRQPGDLENMVRQVKAQLKKLSITDKSRIDEMFLRYNNDRTGYIDINNLRDLCKRLQLPIDQDVLESVICQITSHPEGHISLEEFREFVEN